MASTSYFGDQLAFANEPYLRVIGRYQRDRLHLHITEECAQEVRHDIGFAGAGTSVDGIGNAAVAETGGCDVRCDFRFAVICTASTRPIILK